MSFTLISASMALFFEFTVSFITTPVIMPDKMPVHNVMSIFTVIASWCPLCYALGQ